MDDELGKYKSQLMDPSTDKLNSMYEKSLDR